MLTDSFYREHVPQTEASLVAYRKATWTRCVEDIDFREACWIACARDPLFYFNVFGTLLEPRNRPSWKPRSQWGDSARTLPFLTREYQADCIMRSAQNLGQKDIVVVKSRETGATWMYLGLMEWDWRFHDNTIIGVSSRSESAVDDPDDPDSLFSKIRFWIKHLPAWMRGSENVDWKYSRKNHTITNLRNGSVISGFATGENVGRGGRKKWFFMDELHSFPAGQDDLVMDSVQHVSPCRVMVSTPSRKRGQAGAFYEAVNDNSKDRLLIDIDWKDDREKAAGLYTSKDGRLKKLDPDYVYPKDYEFILDGKTRSPYYDFEWNRPNASEQSIAAELDKDFGGATSRLFGGAVLDKARRGCAPASSRGKVLYDYDTIEPTWSPNDTGDMELWVELDGNHRAPPGFYAAGIDPARGTGTSMAAYSAIVVIDKATGRQVAEFRSNKIKPHELAPLAVAVAKIFRHAQLIPERNAGGGGTELIQELQRIGYGNVYQQSVGGNAWMKKTEKFGYQNQDGGETILSDLEKAIIRDECTILSERIVDECGRYFYKNDRLVHSTAEATADEGSKSKGHGDSAMACALAWLGVGDAPAPEADEVAEEMPDDCFLARREQRKRERAGESPSYWRDYEYAN